MTSLDDHADALGVQNFQQKFGDLVGEPFLNLGLSRKMIHHAGQLGESNQMPIGNISHGGMSDEREQVMGADRFDRDVLQNDHAGFLALFHGKDPDAKLGLAQSGAEFVVPGAGNALGTVA